MPILTCKGCGKSFEAPNRHPKYCRDNRCFSRTEAMLNALRAKAYSPERRHAMQAVQTARCNGSLIPQSCEVCGGNRFVEAHHDDYAAPLDVRWLCRSHHKQHHNKFGPGKNAFRAQVAS
jgi:hypothetical protein